MANQPYVDKHAASPLIMGRCALCDKPPAEPIRATFGLRGGGDFTFLLCRPCARTLSREQTAQPRLPFLWRRIVLTWLAETRGKVTNYMREMGECGLTSLRAAADNKGPVRILQLREELLDGANRAEA